MICKEGYIVYSRVARRRRRIDLQAECPAGASDRGGHRPHSTAEDICQPPPAMWKESKLTVTR